MRHAFALIVTLSLIGFCSGCGKAKLDASSETAFKASTDEVMKTLDDPKKEEFQKAIELLMTKRVLFASGDEAAMKKNLEATFGGKTADEVIADGATAKAEVDADMKKLMNGQ